MTSTLACTVSANLSVSSLSQLEWVSLVCLLFSDVTIGKMLNYGQCFYNECKIPAALIFNLNGECKTFLFHHNFIKKNSEKV